MDSESAYTHLIYMYVTLGRYSTINRPRTLIKFCANFGFICFFPISLGLTLSLSYLKDIQWKKKKKLFEGYTWTICNI